MHIGTYMKDMYSYASDPYAIWRFVPAKQEEGAYYIQSMGTGQYLGAYRGLGADLAPQMSHTPGIYKVYFYGGNGGFRMRQTNVDDPFNNLKADGSRFLVLNYPANGDHQQSWRFEEVGEDEILQFNFFTGNSISVVTLPWATKGSGSINALNGDEFKTYAVKNLEITEDGTRLELTRKDDFEAGEPMILVAGDYESSEHPNVQVQFNVPTDVVDTAAVTANGLVGTTVINGKAAILPSIQKYAPELSSRELVSYAPTAGFPEIRNAWKEKQIKKNPSLLNKTISLPVVVPGLTAGLSYIMDLFVDKDKPMLAPNPSWDNYVLIAEARRGSEFHQFEMFKDGKFNLNALEKAVCSEAEKYGFRKRESSMKARKASALPSWDLAFWL